MPRIQQTVPAIDTILDVRIHVFYAFSDDAFVPNTTYDPLRHNLYA